VTSKRAKTSFVPTTGEAVSSRIAKGVALDLGDGPPVGAAMSRADRRALKKSTRGPRPRRVTWRLLIYLAAVAAVIGISAAAITYYGRHTYFVGFDADAVVIYRGRPGGVLWIQPEIVERTTHTRSDVPAAAVADLEHGKIEPTLDDAHRYLVYLDEQVGVTGSSTTFTTPVPTAAPPTTAGN